MKKQREEETFFICPDVSQNHERSPRKTRGNPTTSTESQSVYSFVLICLRHLLDTPETLISRKGNVFDWKVMMKFSKKKNGMTSLRATLTESCLTWIFVTIFVLLIRESSELPSSSSSSSSSLRDLLPRHADARSSSSNSSSLLSSTSFVNYSFPDSPGNFALDLLHSLPSCVQSQSCTSRLHRSWNLSFPLFLCIISLLLTLSTERNLRRKENKSTASQT